MSTATRHNAQRELDRLTSGLLRGGHDVMQVAVLIGKRQTTTLNVNIALNDGDDPGIGKCILQKQTFGSNPSRLENFKLQIKSGSYV